VSRRSDPALRAALDILHGTLDATTGLLPASGVTRKLAQQTARLRAVVEAREAALERARRRAAPSRRAAIDILLRAIRRAREGTTVGRPGAPAVERVLSYWEDVFRFYQVQEAFKSTPADQRARVWVAFGLDRCAQALAKSHHFPAGVDDAVAA